MPLDPAADPSKAIIAVPKLDQLLVIQGKQSTPVRNLRFYGLTFEGVLEGSSGLSYEYAHACELVDSELRSVSGTGLNIHERLLPDPRILSNNTFETIGRQCRNTDPWS